MKTIQIRIEDQKKIDLDAIFAIMGLDMPTAIRIFLQKVEMTQCIPFDLKVEDDFLDMEEIYRRSEEAKRGENIVGPFDSAEELIASLHSNAD